MTYYVKCFQRTTNWVVKAGLKQTQRLIGCDYKPFILISIQKVLRVICNTVCGQVCKPQGTSHPQL